MTMKRLSFAAGLLLAGAPTVLGQWQTQNFTLKQGWNAIYSNVDAEHTTLEDLTNGKGIEEVWLWQPKLSTLQYIQSPDQPLDTVTRWSRWRSSDVAGSSLNKLGANSAYLVKASQDVSWAVKGRPVPPRYQWTSTGLNFIGFSTAPVSPPVFSNFLAPVNGFGTGAEIFSYNGGDLGNGNPSQLFTLNTSKVNRGQAYWIRATGYNRYYGPFELELLDWSGVHFGDSLSSYRIVLRNTTASPLTVSMQLADSEAAPTQQGIPAVAGTPPVILRGAFQSDTLSHGFSVVNGSIKSWILKPKGQAGSAVEIRLGVNWVQLTGDAGGQFGGILRFTDSLGYLQTDLPLTVTKPDTTGLWVGQATINKVRHGMKAFKRGSLKGVLKTSRAVTPDAPLELTWEAVTGGTLAKTYTDLKKGDTISPPLSDKDGNQIDDPEKYWKMRPKHSSFDNGWYVDDGLVVATGDKTSIDMKVVRKTVASIPTGFTAAKNAATGGWHIETDVAYTGAAVDDTLAPPAADEAGNALNAPLTYWTLVSGTLQGNGNPAWTQADDSSYKAAVAADITLKWRKVTAESTVYETITVNDQLTLYQHEYKTVTKTVYPRQRLTGADIFTTEMPADEWAIFEAPSKPPFDWEGELAKDASGAYVVAHSDTSWGGVPKPMGLRVIVHNDNAATPVANLLQRVYIGINADSGGLALSIAPGLLPGSAAEIRRISAVHLPWSKGNQPWAFTGGFAKGGTLNATVTVAHGDHTSNPFLHTYHPDHDNLDARFEKKLAQGAESYQVKREITLRLNGSQAGFEGLAAAGNELRGEYEEIITLGGKAKLSGSGNETRQYGMKGTVVFNRITPEPTLKTE